MLHHTFCNIIFTKLFLLYFKVLTKHTEVLNDEIYLSPNKAVKHIFIYICIIYTLFIYTSSAKHATYSSKKPQSLKYINTSF